MKFVDVKEVFAEIPDEITLAISISGCPIRCKGCHSQYLWADAGEELTTEVLSTMLERHLGVSCLCFMGGDQDPRGINDLAHWVRTHSKVKVAWYSGRDELNDAIALENFDYVKLGPWDESRGPLNKPTTNQVFYRVVTGALENITSRFWKL